LFIDIRNEEELARGVKLLKIGLYDEKKDGGGCHCLDEMESLVPTGFPVPSYHIWNCVTDMKKENTYFDHPPPPSTSFFSLPSLNQDYHIPSSLSPQV